MKLTKPLLLRLTLSASLASAAGCAEPESDNSQQPDASSENKDEPKSSGDDPSKDQSPEPDKDKPKIDCSKLESTGTEVGQVPPNVTLKDAKGNDVSLHDHCNSIVYIIAGTAG